MKKISLVTLGAGTGQSILLSSLRKFASRINISAIVSVSDNGGHSGLLREQYHIPQVGDGRQCLLALAPPSSKKEQYEQRTPAGHSLGNEQLAELTIRHRSIARAFAELGKEVDAQGRVLPVTTSVVDISARLENGASVTGEWQIIERQPRVAIQELYLQPRVEAYQESIMAVQEADYIVVAPGSLRTGIVSCLLANGMHQALRSAKGQLIFVVNLMTHPGQTDNFTTQDHIDEFARYAERYPDFAILNHGAIPQHLMEHYAAIGSQVVTGSVFTKAVRQICGDFIPTSNNHMVRQERIGDFKKWTHALVHDGPKLAQIIINIINERALT